MAGKARVHELAKELGISSKQVLFRLQMLGEYVQSPSSTVEAPIAQKLRESVRTHPVSSSRPGAHPPPAPVLTDAANSLTDQTQAILDAAAEEAELIRAEAHNEAHDILERARASEASLRPRPGPRPGPGWFMEKNNQRVHHYWDGSRWHAPSWRSPELVFVSYSRVDAGVVRQIVSDLRSAHLEVWLDEELVTGQEWWEEILRRIRGAGVFVHALSDSSLHSEACRAERRYADALNVSVVPVQVAQADLRTSPYGRHQLIDYRGTDWSATAQLIAEVMRSSGRRSPSPQPPPTPPSPPFAYLLELAQALDAVELSRAEQTKILFELIDKWNDAPEASVKGNLLGLVRRLTQRPDATRSTISMGETFLASGDVDPD